MADNIDKVVGDSTQKRGVTPPAGTGMSKSPPRNNSPRVPKKRQRSLSRSRSSDSERESSSSPRGRSRKRSKKKSKKSKKRRKAKRKRKRSRSTSSSSSTSRRSYSPEESRFHIITEEERSHYDLSSDMAAYVNKNFDLFIAEKDIKENILKDHPVPRNIDPVKTLDPSLTKILEGKQETLADKDLETLQSKIRDVMGPLSRIWTIMDEASNKENDDRGEKESSLDDLLRLLEKSVMLLGQANNKVVYFRRLNILNLSLHSKSDAKGMLKTYANLLSKSSDSELFGKDFRKEVMDSNKAQKQTLEMFKDVGKPKKKPFSNGFSNYKSPRRNFGNQQNNFRNVNNKQQKWQKQNHAHDNRKFNFGRQNGSKHLKTRDDSLFQHNTSKSSSKGEIALRSPLSSKFVSSSNKRKHSLSRESSSFSKFLENPNKRFRNSEYCQRLRDTFGKKSNSGENTSKYNFGKRTSKVSGTRNTGNAGKGSHQKSFGLLSNSKPVYKQSFSCKEKRWRSEASNKSKEIKPVCALRTLQNGKFAELKVHVERGRLHVQDRFKRRLLQCSFEPKVTSFVEISMERKLVRVPLPMFWTWSSPSHIYKTFEGSYSSFEENKHQVIDIPGRYFNNGSDIERNVDVTRHSSLPLTTSWFCNKLKEICHGTNSQNRISRSHNRFNSNVTFPNPRKDPESSRHLPESIFEERNFDFGINENNRPSFLYNSSSSTCSNSVSVPSTSTGFSFETRNDIQTKNCLGRVSSVRTEMVDREPKTFQWEASDSTQGPSNYSDRCIPGGLGSKLHGSRDWGEMVIGGKETPYKYPRINCCKKCDSGLYQNEEPTIYSHSNRQHNGSCLSIENGGYKGPETSQSEQRNLELFNFTSDHNYSRIHSKQVECEGRLAVSSQQGLLGMEARPIDFQKYMSESRDTRDRSVCLETIKSDSKILCLETRSLQHSNRCHAAELGSEVSICLPPLLIDPTNNLQNKKTVGSQSNIDNPMLAVTTLVSRPLSNVIKSAITSSNLSQPISKPCGGKTPTDPQQNIKVSGLDGYRQNLLKSGVSGNVAELISKSRRESSTANYNSSWNKWSSWCTGKQVDPFRCNLNYVLEFLAKLFNEGYQYRTINAYRSAISAFHEKIDNLQDGKHPNICALLAGVFNSRPPQPRYTSAWDVQQVLDFIKSKWFDSNLLSYKELTLKLVMLLALTSASRASCLCHLDIRFMSNLEDVIRFKFGKLLKTGNKGNTPPTIEFHVFNTDKSLCVVHTLRTYLEVSKIWRNDEKFQLLLSHRKPHNPVAVSTVSRWIKEVLSLAGIDVSYFKGHSTRSASSSKAGIVGASVQEILGEGRWSKENTWQKFYNKPIISKEQMFQTKVVSDK